MSFFSSSNLESVSLIGITGSKDITAKDDFDFDNEDLVTPRVMTPQSRMTPGEGSLRGRRPSGERDLRGSAKKKTTSFDIALANINKHSEIDNDEMDGYETGETKLGGEVDSYYKILQTHASILQKIPNKKEMLP